METLRLWPVVPNGTFRQLSYEDEVKGPGGKMVKLPKGTLVQVNSYEMASEDGYFIALRKQTNPATATLFEWIKEAAAA